MKNLIKSEFFKLKKSLSYKVMLALSVGVGLMFGFLGITGSSQATGDQMLLSMFSFVMFHTIFTSAFTAAFFCSEFSDRTIGISLLCGLSRCNVFISKIVVFFAGLLCMLSMVVLVPTIITSIANGIGEKLTVRSGIEFVEQMLFFWLVCSATGAFFVFLALATKNSVATIGTGLGIAYILLIMSANYINSGWEKYSFVKYSFVCQMFVMHDWANLQKELFLGVSLITLITALIASLVIFEKTELK